MKDPMVLMIVGFGMMLIATILNVAYNNKDLNSWKNKCIAAGGTPVIEKTFVHCLKPDSFIEIK